jgi:hypothetical protein
VLGMAKPRQDIARRLSRCCDILNKSQADVNTGYWQTNTTGIRNIITLMTDTIGQP